jgi:CO/xanthine dehydrogenase Mo-binding subunit
MIWRSVGNSHTEFARESAVDELATAAARDPVDLRRELLAENPRTLRALELGAECSGWGLPMPGRRARGIACSSFLSHSAGPPEACRFILSLQVGRSSQRGQIATPADAHPAARSMSGIPSSRTPNFGADQAQVIAQHVE